VAYIGTAPTAGQYRKLDNISSSFNGSTTTFTTQVGGQNVSAGTPSQLLVSLGGVIQQPTTDYTVSTNSLTFVTAPASGLSFFAILMGDALSVGTPADGSVSTAKLATGLTVDLTSGSAAAPSLTFDANTGLYSPAEDTIGFVEGGVEAARIDSSGRLLVGTSTSRIVEDLLGNGPQGLIQIEAVNSDAIMSIISAGTADAGRCGTISLGRHRNSTVGATPTVVQSGDALGAICFAGGDGTDMRTKGASIACQVDGTPGADDMPGRLVFSVTSDGASSPTERMRITSAGLTKISNNGGSGSGRYTNAVNHVVHSSVNDDWAFAIQHTGSTLPYGIVVEYLNASPNNTTNNFLRCDDSTTVRASIRSNGGLANFSANNANLSDRNAKKDISLAAGTWDCIKEWEIVNYRYKDQPDDADLNLGVIAQQVAESCPEVITVFSEAKDAKLAVLDDDGNEVEPAQEAQPEKLGVKEQQMYWMAIKALQEAQVRIEQLEAKVAALESA